MTLPLDCRSPLRQKLQSLFRAPPQRLGDSPLPSLNTLIGVDSVVAPTFLSMSASFPVQESPDVEKPNDLSSSFSLMMVRRYLFLPTSYQTPDRQHIGQSPPLHNRFYSLPPPSHCSETKHGIDLSFFCEYCNPRSHFVAFGHAMIKPGSAPQSRPTALGFGDLSCWFPAHYFFVGRTSPCLPSPPPSPRFRVNAAPCFLEMRPPRPVCLYFSPFVPRQDRPRLSSFYRRALSPMLPSETPVLNRELFSDPSF